MNNENINYRRFCNLEILNDEPEEEKKEEEKRREKGEEGRRKGM